MAPIPVKSVVGVRTSSILPPRQDRLVLVRPEANGRCRIFCGALGAIKGPSSRMRAEMAVRYGVTVTTSEIGLLDML